MIFAIRIPTYDDNGKSIVALSLLSFLSVYADNFIQLTRDETSYLKNKKEIKMCVDPNWMPFEKTKNGKYIGLASDYMQLFSREINTPISLLETSSWIESLEKIKNRECDILPMAQSTLLREKYLDFTAPYIEVPIVIASKN